MHLLTITFGPCPTAFAFMFKDAEKALESFNFIVTSKMNPGSRVSIIDDFGQQGGFKVDEIHGWILEDMDKSQLAHIERGLHQARTQAKANTMAQGDPALRAAQMMQGAPILQPRFNG